MNEKKCSRCGELREISLFAVYGGKPHCQCKPCQRESSKNYRKNNIEKCREKERQWRTKTRDIRISQAREWRAKNREKLRAYDKSSYQRRKDKFVGWNRARNLRKNYGITIEQYDEMFKAQSGVCAVCLGMNLSGRRLAVDHNHATGKIRQLLCSRCNSSIGLAKENAQILYKLAEYLEKHETLSSIGVL